MEQELLYAALGEIVDRIEGCGASPELTHAVSFASDLRRSVGNRYNPKDEYALTRVTEVINKEN
ncbi:MAG: hypothetical protein KAS93_06675 [Gammaproteobacteria bacterium]|nr:hypothetical protein [Gammaproteobacteria bacterium]